MADLFSAGADAGTDDVMPDEFYRGLSYLGKPTSITLPGQEPSPPGGLVGAAAGAPVSAPSVTGTPGTGPSPAAPGIEGMPPGLSALLMGASFGNRAVNVGERIAGALDFPSAGAFQTPSGQLTFGAPEALRDIQFPDFPAAAVPDLPAPAIGAATEGAAAGGATGAESAIDPALSALAGEVGSFLPYAGPALGILTGALGDKPAGEQAVDAALNVAGAAASPYTFGLSALAAPLISWALSRLWAPGPYTPKRIESAKTARGDLQGLSEGFREAAGTGDPAQELAALQYQSGDTSATPGRNPVRSQLDLPPDVAQQLGLAPGASQWSQLSPEQFGQFLSFYGADPATAAGYVQGSGDVAYLPQAQAERVASNAADLTNQYLSYLASPPTPEAAPTAEAPSTPEAAAGLTFPPVSTSGEEFPFAYV